MFSEFVGNLRNSKKKKYVILFAFIMLITLTMLITFQYCDTGVYEVWSVEFWDSLFQGNIGGYYQYTLANPRGTFKDQACTESWIQMLPMIIWDLPIWIVHKINGQMIADGRFAIIWHKLLFVVFTLVTSYIVYKISRLYQDDSDKCWMAFFIVLASPELLISTMYAGQDEIIYVCTFLISLYYFLQKKTRKFLFWSIVTDTLNPVMLIFTFALVLIIEKKVYRLILNALAMVSPLVVFGILNNNDKLYASASLTKFLGGIFGNSVSFTQNKGLSIPLIIIIIIFVYFQCYSSDKTAIRGEYVLWLISAMFISFEFLVGDEYVNYFYRSFIYIPFIAILISISKQDIVMNYFLLDIITYSRTLQCISRNFPQVFNNRYVMPNRYITRICEMTGKIRNESASITLYNELIEKSPLCSNIGVFTAVTIAIGAIILYINRQNVDNVSMNEVKLVSNKNIWLFLYFCCMPIFLTAFYYILFY